MTLIVQKVNDNSASEKMQKIITFFNVGKNEISKKK